MRYRIIKDKDREKFYCQRQNEFGRWIFYAGGYNFIEDAKAFIKKEMHIYRMKTDKHPEVVAEYET